MGEESDIVELMRLKREAGDQHSGVCKYRAGDWSDCNYLTKLEERTDEIRRGVSDPKCPDTRRITRNCKKDKRQRSSQQDQSKAGLCVYGKPKDAEWSACQSGVRHKSVDLVEEKRKDAGCPKIKTISKKCKTEKQKEKKKLKKQEKREKKLEKKIKKEEKKEKRRAKKEEKKENKIADKCSFGAWTKFSPCSTGYQHRQREVTRGKDFKLCQKQAKEKRKC